MKKGFTLIELLAVIVILAVIALISVPLILGVIEDSKKGAFKDSVFLTFSAAELYEMKNPIPIDGVSLKDLSLKNNNFISGKIIKNISNELELVNASDGKYCANGILTSLTIYKGLCDKTGPIASIVSNIVTSKSVSLSATCSDLETEIIEYEFSKDGTNYISNGDSNAYKFDNLLSGTNTYYVRCTNKALISVIAHVDVSTNIIDTPLYNISPSGYSKNKIVSIDYPSGYTNEYSMDVGSTWLLYTVPLTISENKTIIARVNDGKNYVTGASFTISTIDNTPPTVNATVSGKVGTLALGDNASLSGYEITTSSSLPTSWIEISGISNIKEYTATSAGTYYAWVKDSAGNTAYSTFNVLEEAFCSYNTGQTWSYGFTGGIQNFIVPCDGTYKLEVYGAKGGNYSIEDGSPFSSGSLGGYAKGNFNLTKGIILNVYVGGEGRQVYVDDDYCNDYGNFPASCYTSDSSRMGQNGYNVTTPAYNLQTQGGGGGGTQINNSNGTLMVIGYGGIGAYYNYYPPNQSGAVGSTVNSNPIASTQGSTSTGVSIITYLGK